MNEMLKAGSFYLLPCLQKLFNTILMYETVPTQWASGFIVPVLKAVLL
jgi:hypothetical protein